MAIRALFFDLDGTLLTSAGRISPATVSALEACQRNGVRVFVATARPPLLQRMLDLTHAEAGVLADGGVYYNGGCIVHGGRRKYQTLSPAAVERCVDLMAQFPEVNYAVQMTGELHAFRYRLPAAEHRRWGLDAGLMIPHEALANHPAVKIVIFEPVSRLPEIHGLLALELAGSAVAYLTGRPGGFQAVEVVAKDVNKKRAADQVLDWCGIAPDQAAVFGDDANDLEMLAGFRCSVAMGNGLEAVRRAARYVTLTNDQDGIPHALARFLGLL